MVLKHMKLFVFPSLMLSVLATVVSVQQKTNPASTKIQNIVGALATQDSPREGHFVAKLILEVSCGDKEIPTAGLLNKLSELDVDDQGCVYAMDYGDVNIKVYDSNGRFLRTIGRQGQGPGEFGGLAHISLMNHLRICILDFLQRRVIIMTTKGEYLSGFLLSGLFRGLAVDNRDRLFLEKSSAIKDPNMQSDEPREIPRVSSMYRTDIAGKELVHLTDIFGESIVVSASGGFVMSRASSFRTVWSLGGDGTLFGGYNENYSIIEFGPDGKKKIIFGRQFSPAKNLDYSGRVGEKKTLPTFRALVIDEVGNLWVELYQDRDTKGFLYDVFLPDGTYMKQVSIEYEIAKFKNGKIYSIVWSEEGYPSIKRFQMGLALKGKETLRRIR